MRTKTIAARATLSVPNIRFRMPSQSLRILALQENANIRALRDIKTPETAILPILFAVSISIPMSTTAGRKEISAKITKCALMADAS